jgi:ribosomal protein S18 acetylase RimI-like enzyme
MILIRPVNVEDSRTVSQLSQQAFYPLRAVYRPKSSAVADAAQPVVPTERLVAEIDGTVTGSVRWSIVNDRVQLIGLASDPTFQRRGVARAIAKYAEEIGPARGCRALSLHTVKETGNAPIFERLGFRVIRDRPDEWSESPSGAPLTDVYMERPLRGEG